MERFMATRAGAEGKNLAELFDMIGILPGTVLTEASLRERVHDSRWLGDAWDSYVLTGVVVEERYLKLTGVRRDRWVRRHNDADTIATIRMY